MRQLRIVAFMSALLAASPAAQAQDAIATGEASVADQSDGAVNAMPRASSGSVLWRDVRAGEPETDLRMRYPKGKTVAHSKDAILIREISVVGECQADVRIDFKEAEAREVVLNGYGGECADSVLTSLTTKYGTPSVQAADSGATLVRDGDVFVWLREGVTIRFKTDVSRGRAFGINYTNKFWSVTYLPTQVPDNL